MSGMSGNPHYEGLARFNNRDLNVPEISYMQAQATLALAYEQRTANLIAYVDKIDDTSAAIPVVNEIKVRLGLNEGAAA